MPSSCLDCSRCKKPCSCSSGVMALFRSRRSRPSRVPEEQQEQPRRPTLLRRAFGGMRNRRRRRHRANSFSSVRAVFWPLMSMGSDADRGDVAVDRPRSSYTDSGEGGGGTVRAPSPSLDTPSASTAAARVLALQARRGEAEAEAEALAASPMKKPTSGTAGGLRVTSSTGAARAPSQLLDTPTGAASTTAARVLALQARLSAAAALAPPPTKPSSKAGGITLRSIAGVCDDVGDVEGACRVFERNLMEMLIEEGKVGDLMDVEELLCCWEKIRSPVFVRLVGRFYGELCMDLFSDVYSAEPIVS